MLKKESNFRGKKWKASVLIFAKNFFYLGYLLNDFDCSNFLTILLKKLSAPKQSFLNLKFRTVVI
jgi:hypothetical protein